MNAATKTKIANLITAFVSIIAVVQTLLSNPPLTDGEIIVAGTILTYLNLALTAWKQYLSAEVSSTGVRVTIWIAVAATLTGLANVVNIFHFSDHTSQTIRWLITIAIAVVNILSKQLFPSDFQQDKNEELKTIDKAKTQ
jgi:hypothetical protein